MTRVLGLLLLVALALPEVASAHATLLRTAPGDGAVLAAAPSQVQVFFDDVVHVGGGNAAVANATGASVLRGSAKAHGHVLTLPLQPGLADGDYSVRWGIVSDDGHPERGVLAFAVGAGRAPPHAVLGAAAPLSWSDIVLRALYYVGLLAGAGAAAFGLLARRTLGSRLVKPLAHLLFFALLATFLGGSGIVHSAPAGTRYALVLKIAVTLAVVGGAAAALAPTYARLVWLAGACSLALAFAPTLSGHALDRDQPRWLSVPVDLAHIGGSAVWLGGLVALAFVLPRATSVDEERRAVVRRFSATAFVAVSLIALTGLGRALTELNGVSQVWSTSYGRLLIVKTALFVPLLGLGWLNRTLLLGVFARVRRSAMVELVLLLSVVVAVAALTELRPGVAEARRVAAAAPPQVAGPATLPPEDAVVDAHGLGPLVVAVARSPGTATVTIIGADGTGADARDVRIDGTRAPACGSGCYRGPAGAGPLRITVDGRATRFDVPVAAPSGAAQLAAVTRAYRLLHTIVFEETLASSPGHAIVTRFTAVAPDRLQYQTRGGPGAIIVGGRRWDRSTAASSYAESPQTPLRVIAPYWSGVTNVHVVAPGVLTFLDRSVPAWFRVDVTRSLPRVVRMTAPAHFMVDRYVGFDTPVTVSPPSR